LKKLDSLGVVVATGEWDSFRFALEAPPASQLDLQNLALVNDTGESATDKITTDPSVKGQVGGIAAPGTTTISTLPFVEIDQNGDAVVDGSVTVDSDKKFSYTPDLASYGAAAVKLRVKEWNNSAGTFTYTAWTTFNLTYSGLGAPAVTDLALQTDTGASATDKVTRDPTLQGRLEGSDVGFLPIHVDLNNDGVDDADGFTDEQGNFVVTPFGLTAGAVTARVRSSRYDAKAQAEVFGPWSSLALTFEATPIPSVADLSLVLDTGSSATDKVTTDPTIRGKLAGDTNLVAVSVEFDHNGDGTPDGYASTDGAGNFAYRPLGLGLGQATVKVRASQWDENLGAHVQGSWSPFTLTIEAAPFVPASMGGLLLHRDTGSSNSDQITTDGAIIGSVYYTAGTQMAGVGYMTVEIDENGDGTADLRTQSDASGQFRYVPLNQPPGTYTIRARTKEWDYTTRQGYYGAWTSITFTKVAPVNSPPQISSFKLRSDSGALQSDGYTANAMVTGTVSNDGSSARLVVEFDHDGNGVGDGLAFTDDQGVYNYSPEPLSFGPVALRARPVEWDEASGSYLVGNWSTLNFTYEQQTNTAPLVTTFALANGTTGGTTDATLSGTIINETMLGGVTLEFDFNGDGVADQFAQTDSLGRYSLTPTGIPYGTVNVQARARETDPVTGNSLTSSWTSYSFTYNQATNAAPTLSGLALKTDDGSSSTDGNSTDPTIKGNVGNDGPVAALTVQIDVNGDGVAEGITTTDASGSFTYRPSGLAFGAQTLRARVKEADSTSGGSLFSPWQTIQFTLVDPVASSVHVATLTLTSDTGNSATDGSTANPNLSGHVANAPSGGVSVEFDLNGDGLSDGTAQTNASGDFSFVPPANLKEGYITARARVASSLPLSAPGFRDTGVTLNYVYNSQPDGAAAQALVTAFHNFNAAWHNAQTVYSGATSAADLAYRQAVDAAEDTYGSTIIDAWQTERATWCMSPQWRRPTPTRTSPWPSPSPRRTTRSKRPM
jgi:large repetitive protein